ncbi:hypothetical protein DSO57_1039370 [Entomophthora muscae]|uniref:Uncharacterized protein n=1 Tax=Entomophthora muscae TaxID=34485 RepID=A0ACC2TKA8_9FUNG|nr:hypothetical protein DSO57_1039370 [Entomophthora muscae]
MWTRAVGKPTPPRIISYITVDEEFYGNTPPILGRATQWNKPGPNFTQAHTFPPMRFHLTECDSTINKCFKETQRRLWLPKASHALPENRLLDSSRYISFRTSMPNYPAVPLSAIGSSLSQLTKMACNGCSYHPKKTILHLGNLTNVLWKPIILEVSAINLSRLPLHSTTKFHFNLLLDTKELDAIFFGVSSHT